MIVIKGNLIIKQVRNSNNSETSSELKNKDIIAFADLDQVDISNAMIITGDVECNYSYLNDSVIVTGFVSEEGEYYAS